LIESDRRFGRVDDGFELSFETHVSRWSLVFGRWSFAASRNL